MIERIKNLFMHRLEKYPSLVIGIIVIDLILWAVLIGLIIFLFSVGYF